MLMRQTAPPPVLPSNAKKFAMGGSRAARALRMSCASIPPTTAHTGESSYGAVVAIVLPIGPVSVSPSIADDKVLSGGTGGRDALNELAWHRGQGLPVDLGPGKERRCDVLQLRGRGALIWQLSIMPRLVLPYGCPCQVHQTVDSSATGGPAERLREYA